MSDRQERSSGAWSSGAWNWPATKLVVGVFLVVALARCNTGPARPGSTPATLRVGVGQIELNPFVEFLTMEGLAKVTESGRLDPGLAKNWAVAEDGLSITVQLRADVRFHDDSPVSAQIVADTLRETLPQFLGAAYEDVLSIQASSSDTVEIKLRRPSSFILESLESTISKPGHPSIGTGPFMSTAATDPVEVRANPNYYLGRPTIDRILVTKYPSVRAAWAELLRGHLDMLYQIGLDELDSAKAATSINVFSFTRRYQYQIILNPRVPALRSASVRRALNEALDRGALIQDALGGHGIPSSGPIWPKNWAAQAGLPVFTFDPEHAARVLGPEQGHTKFKCLVAADDERVALVVKRQLESVGVEMTVEEGTIEQNRRSLATHDFDAILVAAISGPTLFRPYRWWHSRGSLNRGIFASAPVDDALDAIRHSTSDIDYRAGVVKFQKAILDDPPAIFLAWDERARAVSNRFQVPAGPGGDILGTLRLWRPIASAQPGSN